MTERQNDKVGDDSRVTRRRFLQITAVSGSLLLGGKLWHLARSRTQTISETRTLMGTIINLVVVSDNAAQAEAAVTATFAEMARLIAIFDHRRADSPLALLNQTGRLEAPPPELVELLSLSVAYGRLTDGAFDISVKPMVDAQRAGETAVFSRQRLVDFQQIDIRPEQVQLRQPGMALTLDGIAKGRVVDGATAVLQAQGFPNVLVEAGGDLVGLGHRADGQAWHVGIQHPRRQAAGSLLGVLPVSMAAVATSGDYRYRFSEDGRQHHIIDPHTGSSPTELAGVTVMAPTAADADALSTAVMVMNVDAGLALINRLPHVEALLVTKSMQLHFSDGFPKLT